MKELRGVITREELEAYGGAEMILLTEGNESISSQKRHEGSGTYVWWFTYDDTNGFTGVGWEAIGFDYSTITDISERDADIKQWEVAIAEDLGTTRKYLIAGCAGWDGE